jgi:formylmethanofuran dehydrogenase subunit E
MGNISEEELKIEEVKVGEIERAPIFESIRCEKMRGAGDENPHTLC